MIHKTGKIKHRGNEIDQGSKMNYETNGAPYKTLYFTNF